MCVFYNYTKKYVIKLSRGYLNQWVAGYLIKSHGQRGEYWIQQYVLRISLIA